MKPNQATQILHSSTSLKEKPSVDFREVCYFQVTSNDIQLYDELQMQDAVNGGPSRTYTIIHCSSISLFISNKHMI